MAIQQAPALKIRVAPLRVLPSCSPCSTRSTFRFWTDFVSPPILALIALARSSGAVSCPGALEAPSLWAGATLTGGGDLDRGSPPPLPRPLLPLPVPGSFLTPPLALALALALAFEFCIASGAKLALGLMDSIPSNCNPSTASVGASLGTKPCFSALSLLWMICAAFCLASAMLRMREQGLLEPGRLPSLAATSSLARTWNLSCGCSFRSMLVASRRCS